MKKILTKSFLFGSLVLILGAFDFWHNFVVFAFVGALPGTNLVASPDIILTLCPVIAGVIIGQFLILPALKNYNFNLTPKKQKINA